MNERILLVDDEPDFLDVLREFLIDEGYQVCCAPDGKQALELLAKDQFDLLLSDINMPVMKGFELLNRAREQFPKLKSALITAYEVRDYLRMAKEYEIGNIITKTTPFNFREIALLIHNLLTEDVFGLDHYIQGTSHSVLIDNTSKIDAAIEQVIAKIPPDHQRTSFTRCLGEILVNAMYYGSRSESPVHKENWKSDMQLGQGKEVIISWATDSEKSGISVCDQRGILTKKEILYWLERNTTKGENGLSLGLFDDHGKGIFITRETIDRLIINVKQNYLTEVVMINYAKGQYSGYRPLWIHEF